MEQLAAQHGLARHYPTIVRRALPALAFTMETQPSGRSRFGGAPLLPPGFGWPMYVPRPLSFGPQEVTLPTPRPLDFLLQLDLAELASFDVAAALPREGMLTFFYDTENQPWGYDPQDLGGSRVVYVEPGPVVETPPPLSPAFDGRSLRFWPSLTLPHVGSRAFEALGAELELPDSYVTFASDFERRDYPAGAGRHRLFGHAANVQGDMQLEAQLVTHGLYCGDSTGYEDPRTAALEATCEDWTLLLQLDTDDNLNLMWGDCGTLFYWIRKQDLAARRFDRCWMTLQCG